MPNLKDKDQHQPKKIRRDIQALRAFAVMSVVLYHLWPEHLVGGFTGVDIFFVISGYLMTTSIIGRLNPLIESREISAKSVLHLLSEFYARRIKRLVPAALVTLLGILGLVTATNNLTIIIDNAKNVVSAATFWENWSLAEQSVDYLHSEDAPVASQHFWSLSLEEQFYLMWPLLLVASALITVNLVIYYRRSKISGAILPITLITIASAAYGYWLTQDSPSIAYFSTPARVWELMMGGIIAFLPTLKNYDLKLLLPYGGLAMCLYSVFFITGDGFPGWHALIPTIGVALIILGGADRIDSKLAFDSIFRWRPIQWVGDISYSVYLWHWPLIILLPVLVHHDINGRHGMLFKLGIIALSLVIAYLSYRFVEEPTRKIQIKTRYIYALFVLTTGFIVICGFALQHYGNQQIKSRLNTMHAAVMKTDNTCLGARAILNQAKCGDPFGKFNSSYMSIGQQDKFLQIVQSENKPCYSFFVGVKGRENPTKYCTFGDVQAEKTIILLGDSHAEQYINAFNDIGKRNHYKIHLLNLGSCSNWKNLEIYPLCKDRINFITQSGILDDASFVVVSALFRHYSDGDNLLSTLKAVTETNFALLQDTPRPNAKQVENCYHLNIDCATPRAVATADISSMTQRLVRNGVIENTQVIDTYDMFCNSSKCPFSIGGLPVYFNTTVTGNGIYNSHMTASYSLSLAPLLEEKLRKNGVLDY